MALPPGRKTDLHNLLTRLESDLQVAHVQVDEENLHSAAGILDLAASRMDEARADMLNLASEYGLQPAGIDVSQVVEKD